MSAIENKILEELKENDRCLVVLELKRNPSQKDLNALRQIGAWGRGRIWSVNVSENNLKRIARLYFVGLIRLAKNKTF